MNEGDIYIRGEITPETMNEVDRLIKGFSDKDTLVVHIASPGGSVYAGYNIGHMLRLSGKKIKTIIEGEASSMATFISASADPGEAYICNPGKYMIHNPSSGIEGTADKFEQGVSELRSIEDAMIKVYAQRTKMPEDKIKEMMKAETTLTAEQAMKMGFVDKVLNTYMRAAAFGKQTKPMNKIQKFIAGMTGLLAEVVAITLMTTDGKALNIQAEEGEELIGKPITVDGQPGNGKYVAADGRTLVCVNGVVTEVIPAGAPPAQQPPTQAPPAEDINALKAKLAALEAEKAAAAQAQADKAKVKAEQEAQEKAKAKADEMEALKKQLAEAEAKLKGSPLGTTDGPTKPPAAHATGGVTGMKPIMLSAKSDPRAIDATRTFLANSDAFKWIRQYYPPGFFDQYVTGGPKAVSILETDFDFTWNGILTTDIFLKPTLDSPALSDIFTIDQGISWQKKYNLLGQLEKLLKPYTGCGVGPNNNLNTITNTTLQTKEFRMYEGWCKDDFTDQLEGLYNHLAQEWLKTGEASFDPAGTPVDRLIMEQLRDALRRDVARRVFFAAGNSSDVDYNQIDGLWDRLIDSSGASNYCVRRAGSALGTGTLSAGDSLEHLETAYSQSNLLLRQAMSAGKTTYWVTQSIWDNYYNSLIGTGAVTEQAFGNLQKGLSTLTYKGIAVRPVPIWDYFLAEADNPLTAVTRHLILLTQKENHILGVENGSDLNKIVSWFEMKDDKRYYRADMKFGYQYLHCDLQLIMY